MPPVPPHCAITNDLTAIKERPATGGAMADPLPTPSPASKSLADRLAKYSYNVDPTPSPKRQNAKEAGPSTPPIIASPIIPKEKNARLVTPRRKVRRERDAYSSDSFDGETDDEYGEEKKRVKARVNRKGNVKIGAGGGSGRKPRPFAGPEVYSHLPLLPDRIKPGLDSTLPYLVYLIDTPY